MTFWLSLKGLILKTPSRFQACWASIKSHRCGWRGGDFLQPEPNSPLRSFHRIQKPSGVDIKWNWRQAFIFKRILHRLERVLTASGGQSPFLSSHSHFYSNVFFRVSKQWDSATLVKKQRFECVINIQQQMAQESRTFFYMTFHRVSPRLL